MLCLLLPGCYKERATPPEQPPGPGDVSVRYSLINGAVPFRMDSSFTDSYGNRLRITRLKFLLGEWHALDDEDVLVADLSGPVVLVDGGEPVQEHHLGRMADGHIHTLEFRAGPVDTNSLVPEMIIDGQAVHLVLQGYVDSNADGAFTEGVDVAFDYRASGADAARDRHIHVHADMVGGVPVTLALQLDVRFLLIGVDPMMQATSSGNDTLAQRIMDNLVAMTWAGG